MFDIDRVAKFSFIVSLGASTLLYFAFTRFIQDMVYRLLLFESVRFQLFASFESYLSPFIQAEPLEIPFYVFGFVFIPLCAYFIAPIVARFMPQGFDSTHEQVIVSSSKEEVTHGEHEQLKRQRCFRWHGFLCITMLVILIVHPNAPVEPHHSNYFIGPAYQITQGKALLYESSSLYGLVSTYVLVALYTIIPFSFTSFTLLIIVVYLLYYSALWLFIRYWLNSRFLATITTFMILAATYVLPSTPERSVLLLPAMSPFRWGLYVVVLLLMLRFEHTKRVRYLRLSLFISAFSLFWNFDSGLFLTAATLGTIGYVKIYSSQFGVQSIVKKLAGMIAEYLAYAIGLFVTLSVANRFIYGLWPRWELFLRESIYFSQGIIMKPLPIIGLFELFVFVYLIVIVIAFVHLMQRRPFSIPLLFVALFGLTFMIYYVGESRVRILWVLVAPFFLICAYGYRRYQLGKLSVNNSVIVRSGCIVLALVAIGIFAVKLPSEFSARSYSVITERFSKIDPLDQETHDDGEYLAKHYVQHRIPVMSLNDLKLMMYSGKVNWFDFYYIFTIYFKQEMQKYIDITLREKPEYVVVGKGEYRNDQVEYFFEGIKSNYQLKEGLKTVEVYQKR